MLRRVRWGYDRATTPPEGGRRWRGGYQLRRVLRIARRPAAYRVKPQGLRSTSLPVRRSSSVPPSFDLPRLGAINGAVHRDDTRARAARRMAVGASATVTR